MKRKYLLIAAVFCIATININAQNNPPVAVNDSSIVIYNFPYDTTIQFNVLLNDHDPDGYPIKITEVFQQGKGEYFNYTDSTIIYTIYTLFEVVFQYRVCETADTSSLSNWAYLYINPQMDINAPVARNDTITCVPGYPATANVLLNDYDPNGDSFYLYQNINNIIYDSTIEIIINFNEYYTL